MPSLQINSSWLNSHDYCEYKFHRQYVLKEYIPRTKAMVVGSAKHELKEEKFLEVATPTTMEDFLASTSYTITKEIRLQSEFDDFLLVGKIDELGVDANNIYIIDDKPKAKPYQGTLRQLWAYSILFRKNFPQVNKKIFTVIRDRDFDRTVWTKMFSDDNEKNLFEVFNRIMLLFQGKITPEPTTNPNRCNACILHKLDRCKFSSGNKAGKFIQGGQVFL